MPKKPFENIKPENIGEYIEYANDKSDYKKRLIAIEFLSKYKCYESKSTLYNLMTHDKIYTVKEQSFRALQNFGENVKLPKKGKGKIVKSINDKLLIIHNSFDGDKYSITDFKLKFKEKYPYVYDIYNYEKKSKLNEFILNTIKTFPKKKIKHKPVVHLAQINF